MLATPVKRDPIKSQRVDVIQKLPFHLRVQLQIVLQSRKVNDTVKSIESHLKKLPFGSNLWSRD